MGVDLLIFQDHSLAINSLESGIKALIDKGAVIEKNAQWSEFQFPVGESADLKMAIFQSEMTIDYERDNSIHVQTNLEILKEINIFPGCIQPLPIGFLRYNNFIYQLLNNKEADYIQNFFKEIIVISDWFGSTTVLYLEDLNFQSIEDHIWNGASFSEIIHHLQNEPYTRIELPNFHEVPQIPFWIVQDLNVIN